MAGDLDKPDATAAEKICTAALALPPSERPTYLATACGENQQLREHVEALLRARAGAENLLPEQAASLRPEVPTFSAFLAAALTEKPGDTIGPYTLQEKLGEGGCGVVYLAEQEEPVKRKVALKIIKLGMDTRQVVARFEAERQALALMDHTNIAKVLEAGATATGRPYFVMELVGGIKITDYCEQNHLDTQQRLDLFIQVCRAVQHAHQKGVIHRDIKPSNVLVATQDGVPVPKVIDFGIAKATQGKLTDETVFTAFEQFLGTPAYMSPEQTQPGGLDVDTRSDIYSLGVLLYELLTGKTPFETKELLAAGLDAMRRTIREKEPPTPSTRVKQEVAAQQASGSGQSNTTSYRSKVANDLDWIVMKCLEKDRGRRYETANGLALDIERHLHNEPVLAGPPSTAYRLDKFVRRNKTGVIFAGLVSSVLVLGIIVSAWEARQQSRLRQQAQLAQVNEARERKKAETEAARSQQVATLLQDMLEGVGPSKALGRDTTMLKEILDKTAQRLGAELTNQPEVEIELRMTLGHVYRQLGLYREMRDMAKECLRLSLAGPEKRDNKAAQALYQLSYAELGLGNLDAAETSANEAVNLARSVYGPDNSRTADTLGNLAQILRRRGKLVEAEAAGRAALEIRRRGNDSDGVASSLASLAHTLGAQGKLSEAEGLMREALELRKKLSDPESREVADAMNDLATILFNEGKLNEAETNFVNALSIQRKLLGEVHPDVANTLNSLANVQQNQNRLTEAEATHRRALDIYRSLTNMPGIILALGNLAVTLAKEGRLQEAESTIRESLPLEREALGADHPDVASSLNTLAVILEHQNRHADAIEPLREAVRILRDASAGDATREPPLLGLASANLAGILLDEQHFDEARSLAEESVKLFERHPDWSPYDRHHAERVLASALLPVGKSEEAERILRRLLEELLAGKPPKDPELARAVMIQTAMYQMQGKLDEAAKLYRESLPAMRDRLPPTDPKLIGALAHYVSILLSSQKFAEAEPVARECLEIRAANSPGNWLTFSTRCQVGAALLGQQKYADAEPFLLSGYEGMKQSEPSIPPPGKARIRDALQSLVRLYENKGAAEQAAEWRKKLEEFEQSRQKN
jgi:serine/threonine protein kinase/tetratricopeptide (TPR) repeat protein